MFGDLNVCKIDITYTLGIPTGSTSTWYNVKDALINSISGITSLSTKCDNLLANLTTISGNAASIANIANYYSGLQSSIAVTNGVVSTAGLILAFDLKQDRFDVKLPLSLRNPVTANSEYFKQFELNFNTTLLLDNSVLTINTREFLCPLWGDLGMVSTPNNITTSTSLTYVVVKQLSQPITCMSSLNVSGTTTLNYNVTCMNNLNINGALYCSSINSTTTTVLTSNLNSLSSYAYLNISGLNNNINSLSSYSYLNISGLNSNLNNFSSNSTLIINGHTTQISNLNSTSTTIFNALNSLSSCSVLNVNSLNVSGTSVFNNDITAKSNLYAVNIPKKSMFNIELLTLCSIGSTTYYKYDLDLRLYTKFITIAPTTTTRKFKFMCAMGSGAHNFGMYSLNYDIDYSFTVGLNNYNGLNALAYGYPYENYRLNKITPNGLFIWKLDFNYITVFGLLPALLQCVIIDYL
jgi:hypothetical protein